jgi:hypothetical protein
MALMQVRDEHDVRPLGYPAASGVVGHGDLGCGAPPPLSSVLLCTPSPRPNGSCSTAHNCATSCFRTCRHASAVGSTIDALTSLVGPWARHLHNGACGETLPRGIPPHSMGENRQVEINMRSVENGIGRPVFFSVRSLPLGPRRPASLACQRYDPPVGVPPRQVLPYLACERATRLAAG